MVIEIKSEQLTVQFKTFGGALSSIKNRDGVEYLWQGDATYWSGQAPVLFPICGSLREDTAFYSHADGTETKGNIPRHGLVRKKEFELVDQTENSVTFAIEDDENTYQNYPYHFRLEITYLVTSKIVRTQYKIYNKETNKAKKLIEKLNLKQFFINNRRYLGNKYSLTNFIKKIVEENCKNINTVADVFSGTGSVSDIFKDRELITNDLLYCNYISNYAWFFSEDYSEEKVINTVYEYNKIETSENNYVRENFADTFFSADDCSKIGYIREDIEKKYKNKEINYKEYSILITTLLYAMDRIANTVGHYDAYRKKVEFDKELYLGIMLPDKKLSENNKCFNEDATNLVKKIKCDLLYLDPPYNSRQYSDAYHLLENIAKWQKPEVFGVARKMDRKAIKSSYCTVEATQKFRELIENTNAKYILLSYNNMSEKGDDRSNAKISDKDIFKILEKKGKVKVFEEEYKMFSTGKSNVKDNKERLFLCEVEENKSVSSPFNYTGGKYKLLEHLQKLFKEDEIFLDIFTGGANVGINSKSSKIIFNDVNDKIISLMKYIKNTETEELLKKNR